MPRHDDDDDEELLLWENLIPRYPFFGKKITCIHVLGYEEVNPPVPFPKIAFSMFSLLSVNFYIYYYRHTPDSRAFPE